MNNNDKVERNNMETENEKQRKDKAKYNKLKTTKCKHYIQWDENVDDDVSLRGYDRGGDDDERIRKDASKTANKL